MTIPPRAPNIPPFLGNVLSFAFSPTTFLLRLIANYGDVVNFDLVGSSTYIIAHPEAIQDVLIRKQHAFTKSLRSRRILGQTMGTGLITSVDEYHTRQHHLIEPAFRYQRLSGYIDSIIDLTNQQSSTWHPHRIYDMHQEMMNLTMHIIFKTLFGLDASDAARPFAESIEVLQRDCHNRLLNPVAMVMHKYFQSGKEHADVARAIVNNFIMGIITDRRAQRTLDTGDLLSILFLSPDENGDQMTDTEVRDEAVTLFATAYETTASLLTWMWYALAQHPDVKQKVYDEIATVLGNREPALEDLHNLNYITMLRKEVVRYYPPTWMLLIRKCIEDVEVGGYTIPDYADILISPYVMHRNSRWWDDVHRFNPERFTPENEEKLHAYQYIPFSTGEHGCMGSHFALMIAQIVLVTVARNYDLELVNRNVKESAHTVLTPRGGLTMRVTPRH